MVTNSDIESKIDEINERLKQIRLTREATIEKLNELNKTEIELVKRAAAVTATGQGVDRTAQSKTTRTINEYKPGELLQITNKYKGKKGPLGDTRR